MTAVNLITQILRRVQALHKINIMHRDIKPENLCIGADRRSKRVYLIDFGLSKFFIDPRTNNHIDMLDGKKLTGTARYTSLNSHNGLEQSRRDDLASICYVMAIFLNGRLPW
jgi:serine/threonine protein kinase